jgi:hypothetical protein
MAGQSPAYPERPAVRLIAAMERAALAGWAETMRLACLILTVSVTVVVVLAASRYLCHLMGLVT